MKIKLFENFDKIDLDITYELWTLDKNGDEVSTQLNADGEYNPYDLTEIVELFEKHETYDLNLSIRKITKEYITPEIIERVKMEIETKKYNV